LSTRGILQVLCHWESESTRAKTGVYVINRRYYVLHKISQLEEPPDKTHVEILVYIASESDCLQTSLRQTTQQPSPFNFIVSKIPLQLYETAITANVSANSADATTVLAIFKEELIE